MKKYSLFLSSMMTFSTLILMLHFLACTPKKLSNNYGDNKTYADEDSTGGERGIKEKNAKMPFDTVAAPKFLKVEPNLPRE